MKNDLINRQAAIDGKISIQRTNGVEIYSDEAVPVEYLKALPSAQPDDWLTKNKDKILKAGLEGRELDFYIGGRLFAIREKAQ